MKKSLIALAALASISAFAQTAAPAVTVYGLIDISYSKVSTADDGLLLNDKNSTSRVGLKGSSDVGGGMKANFNLESGGILVSGRSITTNTTTTSTLANNAVTSTSTSTSTQAALFDRQAWAGLSGSFGEVRAGTQDPVGFQTNIGFDLNGAANDSQAAFLAGVPTLGNGGKTLAQYISPDFGGLKVQLGYMPKGDNKALVDANGKASYAAGVSYVRGPLALAAAYESASTDTVGQTGNNWSSVSGSYDFGVAKLVATYANGGDGLKGSNLGVAVPVMGASVGVQVAKNSDTNNTGVELFANKEFLKGVTGYVDFGKAHNDASGANTDLYSLGVIWTF